MKITIRRNSVTDYTYTFYNEKGYFNPTKEQLERWEWLINIEGILLEFIGRHLSFTDSEEIQDGSEGENIYLPR